MTSGNNCDVKLSNCMQTANSLEQFCQFCVLPKRFNLLKDFQLCKSVRMCKNMFIRVIQIPIWWEKSGMDECPGVIFTFEYPHLRL